MFAPAFIGLAILPRECYAYAAGPGTLTTHPIIVTAGGLWLNADGDGIAVEALDASGATLGRGALGSQRRQSVYRKVAWAGSTPGNEAGSTPGNEVRLRVTLNAGQKLYSIGFG